ncbi:DUF6600 domain-containing protein [Spirosoma sordidisoli]|uniref:BcpO-related WXXGXW repeat protein n=1 Tax=Spirosoma sordidisoli TaxID=2502893 RepID=A0A4Q2UV46_9BACT|nr:DUF6600 domain-containing protein [Spirosoma sordidisoli]RYC71735.1 hypothetical protein EQG79_06295 [Spirosoma sordidisoli]
MKTTGNFRTMIVGMALSLAGITTTLAQGGYGQPDYGQPDYNQPGYDQAYGQPYNQPGGPVPSQDFYNDLGPYGQWVNTPEYGRVWIPNVEPGFQPYATNGHWVVTEYGNTWVSDYAWGWAPFHYGRWYLDRYRRWAWVPGYDWGPAWVSWRSGGGYYGWAPLGPGININVNINIPADYWVFVPQVYITSPRLYNYCVPRPRVVNIYHNTTIINNVYRVNNRAYAYGPRREEIEYVTRRSVPVYRVENAGRPGRTVVRDNTVGFYRPEASRGSRGGAPAYTNDRPAYTNSRPDYGRRDYRTNSGAYTGATGVESPRVEAPGTSIPGVESRGSGASRTDGPRYDSPRYSPRGQSSDYSGRTPRYEPQAQSTEPAPQTGSGFPQPSRRESFPQRESGQSRGTFESRGQGQIPTQRESMPQSRGGRVESFPQRDNSPVQPQRSGGFESRGQGQPVPTGQPQMPQGGFPAGRGGSRGPR